MDFSAKVTRKCPDYSEVTMEQICQSTKKTFGTLPVLLESQSVRAIAAAAAARAWLPKLQLIQQSFGWLADRQAAAAAPCDEKARVKALIITSHIMAMGENIFIQRRTTTLALQSLVSHASVGPVPKGCHAAHTTTTTNTMNAIYSSVAVHTYIHIYSYSQLWNVSFRSLSRTGWVSQ